LLKYIYKIKTTPELLLFQSALALHCFTNEYIYNLSKEETSLIESVENEIHANFSKGALPNESLILCLASYKALNQYDWSESLENNTQISDVISRQILEPKHENQIKSELPTLQIISNQISSKVRGQYEDNPYPRWVNTGLSKKSTIYSEIKSNLDLRLSDTRIYDVDRPNILIAGCGTGQHSIRVASKFKEAKILAIDLSLSSLAYAKRKTIELGIENIDYMQADILDLEKLNRKFDMIQSSGVLHHMENPIAGWHTLKNCLKTGGLMKIGLYSNLARNHIVKIREEVKQSGIDLDDASIRLYRENLINSKEEHHMKIKLSNNFYSLSEIRDLLFHVQEHRFTIPKIKKCLNELGLDFCGFDSEVIIKDFLQYNPEKLDLYDLDKWSLFEEKKPDAFIAMYQFWCQNN
jgi:2-polyprenyl-3-methyl-5-hydroxy-6-metoxy-1,4-benzoquinol methylase